MKRIKYRYQSMLFSAVILLATGCSQSETVYTSAEQEHQPTVETVAQETQQIIIETEPFQETTANAPETEAAPAVSEPTVDTTVMPHQLHTDIQYLYKSKWEGAQQLFNGKVAQIYVLGEKYPALQNAMMHINQTNQEDLDNLYQEQLEYAKEMMETYPDFPGLEFERAATVARADEHILSIALHEYSWLGGAHPNTYLTGYNFDPVTGEELRQIGRAHV